MSIRSAAFVLLLAGAGSPVLAEETWDQWRGPGRDGRAEMLGMMPVWPEKPVEVWRALGTSLSPLIADGRVIVHYGGDEGALV